MHNQLKIYKSSAGSGKTYTLVKEYLRLVLKKPDEYKHILAITFTNKATEEMKSRIVESLIELKDGKNGGLREELAKELPKTDVKLHAQMALDNILHDYSNFSVCTIDSFFNRVIQSIAREIQLPLGLEVQLNTDEVIEEMTSLLMADVSNDAELSQWLTDFLFQKLREDKGWSIEGEIESIAKELFKEKSIDRQAHSRKQVRDFFQSLKTIKAEFEKAMKSFGDEALKILDVHELSADDFAYKSAGVAGYFGKIRDKNKLNNYVPSKRTLDGAASSDSWCPKTSPHRNIITPLVENTLLPLLRRALEYYEKEFPAYAASVEVLKRIFLLGIVEDLKKKLQQYRTENNLLLISDTPKILGEVISAEETPFLYEKTGSRFHHFLIDEFQDTSDLQWKNLLPLVINSLSAGNFTMVVGDVKQSIYRWRSGNMNLLANELREDLSTFSSIIKEESLDTNYRSKKNIIDFNNEFFSAAPAILNQVLELDENHLLNESYSKEAQQKVAERNGEGGYIQVNFFSSKENDEETISWKDIAKEKLIAGINKVCEYGYKLGDIAVLVRNNKEGDEVATFLIGNGITKVISPDSLLLVRSPKIRFLINAMRYLDDKNNHLVQTYIAYGYTKFKSEPEIDLHSLFTLASLKQRTKNKAEPAPSLFEAGSLDDSVFNRVMPEAFTAHTIALSKLPVYELCEELIRIFGLDSNDAYVLRFLDLVLEYSSKHNSSVKNFIQWWDESPSAQNTAVVTSENEDAIRIMTIHRSKGLQFPVVFMPFTDWKLQPDARDILWVKSEASPFNEFGKVPVSPSKHLMHSAFKEDYEEEIVLSAIDNINLLYVAFTRAEEQLYIFCPDGSTENMNSVSKLVRKVMEANADWKKQLQSSEEVHIGAMKEKSAAKQKSREESFELTKYETLNWKEKIRLSTHSDELIEMLNLPAAKAINYGVLVHRVLSSIGDVKDINRVVQQLFFEGLLTTEEKEHLEKELSEVLAVEEIAAFFSGDYTVMSEREIILPSGEMLRPDRVLVKDTKAIVIDFKSGKQNKSHEAQVNRYAEVLQQMGYTFVKKYLVYLAERKVIEVSGLKFKVRSQTSDVTLNLEP
jgi:ATP-dependent helicase/nuclease subunit A